ncbi:MAG: sensor protein VraS [Bacteroidota bacterium]|jgi:signal transduction histidine kinase
MTYFVQKFYLFFEGMMIFQIIFFGMLFRVSNRKEVLYYSILNLVAAIYFFLNSPDTFFDIDNDEIFTSKFYPYINYALLLSMFYMYLVFLKEFFNDTVKKYKQVFEVFRGTTYIIPTFFILMIAFQILGLNFKPLYYISYLINAPFCTLILLYNYKEKGYKSLIIYGMFAVFISVIVTILFTIRNNEGWQDTVLDKYPLAIIKVGMLVDILLFQLALLTRWNDQEKQLVVEKLQKELAVEKVRNQISKELHDDIGSTLSGINMYSHMAKELTAAGDTIASGKTLEVIQEASDDMLYKLKDMVWAMQPGNERIEQLTERINTYAVFITGAKKIKLQTNFATETNSMKMAAETIHHLYTIAKEALNNAVKYSGANLISISTECTTEIFTLRIADNGVGFNTEQTLEGNGLINMKKRAKEIGAEFYLASKRTQGTSALLKIKLT